MQKTLPKGWKWVRLGEVLERRTEQILLTEHPDALYTYIDLEHIESNTGNLLASTKKMGIIPKAQKISFRKGIFYMAIHLIH